ncbi:MAG: hypothetical protein JOS17DRAFT_789012 [Linnemannia elongata]|nr:MAG: hypothetical protein JOS17DRAFT_789012 [Linnemannia elongata]
MQSSLSLSRVPGIPPGRLLAQQPCSLIPLRHIVCPQAGCRIQPSRSSASRSSQASFRFLEAEDSSEQVRAIIEAFPSLEYLSIRVQEAEREVIERWDYLEHSLLLLEYRHIWSIARALVKLSSVRNVCYGSLTSGNFSLQQTPKAFPVLGRLRIQCSGGHIPYAFLARMDVERADASNLVNIRATCRVIECLRFNFHERCSKELHQVDVACSTLKA